MNDLELMSCIERTRRSERRPDMLHILDECARRLQVKGNVTPPPVAQTPLKTSQDVTPCPICEAARKRNVARQKRYRQKYDGAKQHPET